MKIIKEDGGAMGFGYMVLPITIFINLGIITSLFVLIKKEYSENGFFFTINLIILLISILLLMLKYNIT